MTTHKKLNKRDPNDPEVVERVLARLRAMSPDEMWELLKRRPEGVEETHMNERLAEYDRKQAELARAAEAANPPKEEKAA